MGYGWLGFLSAVVMLAVATACSVSLVDSAPERLRYCSGPASSSGADALDDTGHDDRAGSRRADGECIPRLPEACPGGPSARGRAPGAQGCEP